MTKSEIKEFVVYSIAKSFRNFYLNPHLNEVKIYMLNVNEHTDVELVHEPNSSSAVLLSMTIKQNERQIRSLIEDIIEKLPQASKDTVSVYVDYLLDHDETRENVDFHLNNMLKTHYPAVYQEVVVSHSLQHLERDETKSLIESAIKVIIKRLEQINEKIRIDIKN